MRTIGILGSPRRFGNTGTLIDAALSEFKKKGHETAVHHLAAMDVSDCNGCFSCKTDPKRITGCVVDDDMQLLYRDIQKSDAVIVGSPIYMHGLTGRTVSFLNRLYAFHRPGKAYGIDPPKPAFLFATHGQSDHDFYNRSLCLPVGAMSLAGLRFVDIFSVGQMMAGPPLLQNNESHYAVQAASRLGSWFVNALEKGMTEDDFKRFGSMDGLDIATGSGVISALKLVLKQ